MVRVPVTGMYNANAVVLITYITGDKKHVPIVWIDDAKTMPFIESCFTASILYEFI